MVLRPYQSEILSRLNAALHESGSVCLQMPTASGKTLIAASVLRNQSDVAPTWFVCHRVEIISQTSRHLSDDGIEHGIVAPGHRLEPKKRVQVISIDTLTARGVAALPEPGTLVWDEAHHIVARSWLKVKALLPNAWHLGMTATPQRLDGKLLSEVFNALVCGPSTKALIADGWLVPFRYFAPSIPDLEKVKLKKSGEYDEKSVEAVMNTPVLIGDAIAEYQKWTPNGRALLFSTSVEASRRLAASFIAAGIPALHLDGTTDKKSREQAITDLAAGRIKVITNVGLFTEGVDVPELDAVILMRPTKSLALYLQMVGRVLRKTPGKETAFIMDHAGLYLDHGMPDEEREWSITADTRKAFLERAKKDGVRYLRDQNNEVRAVAAADVAAFAERVGRQIEPAEGVLYELRDEKPEGCVTKSEFARRMNLSAAYVTRNIERGLPTRSGFILYEEARQWVSKNLNPNRTMAGRASVGRNALARQREEASRVSVSLADWAAAVGVGVNTVQKMIKSGAPHVRGVKAQIRVIPSQIKEWADKNWRAKQVRPFNIKERNAYECRDDFGRRIGNTSIAYLAGKGLPCAENGWVHIYCGLCWVRDNTNIKIPDSAWEGVTAPVEEVAA